MAYTLLTTNYGSAYANLDVFITETGTATPAILLSSATGGLISSRGQTKLNGSGVLSVYVDNTKTFTVRVDDGDNSAHPITSVNQFISSTDLTTLVGQPGVVYTLNTAPYDRYVWNGTALVVQPTVSNSGNIIGSGGAPVSGGGITEAQAAAGTDLGDAIGTVRQISNGDGKGARVRWFQPDGYQAPVWCWDAWPQSVYEG